MAAAPSATAPLRSQSLASSAGGDAAAHTTAPRRPSRAGATTDGEDDDEDAWLDWGREGRAVVARLLAGTEVAITVATTSAMIVL
jgi:ABC-type microcin C transport system permease subunit YejE